MHESDAICVHLRACMKVMLYVYIYVHVPFLIYHRQTLPDTGRYCLKKTPGIDSFSSTVLPVAV